MTDDDLAAFERRFSDNAPDLGLPGSQERGYITQPDLADVRLDWLFVMRDGHLAVVDGDGNAAPDHVLDAMGVVRRDDTGEIIGVAAPYRQVCPNTLAYATRGTVRTWCEHALRTSLLALSARLRGGSGA